MVTSAMLELMSSSSMGRRPCFHPCRARAGSPAETLSHAAGLTSHTTVFGLRQIGGHGRSTLALMVGQYGHQFGGGSLW